MSNSAAVGPTAPSRLPVVLVIATLDTKSEDVAFLARAISEQHASAVVMDTSTRAAAEPILGLNSQLLTRDEVAQAGGHTIAEVAAMERGDAASAMRVGVRELTTRLAADGRIDGAICLGGAGAHMAQWAFQLLPLGFPKLVVSPLASGDRKFEPYVGLRDVAVLHSVADIAGVNAVTERIYRQAAGYIAGAARATLNGGAHTNTPAWTIAVSMNGNTTPAITRARERLEARGLEVVAFHANGVGGRALEDFVSAGTAVGVLDYTTTELSARLVGGLMDPGPMRMEAAGRLGVPQVLVPGCVDFITSGRWEETEREFPGRVLFAHNPELTLVRLTRDEMAEMGSVFASKANSACGPTAIYIPTRGFSVPDCEGGFFWDPDADQAFIDALQAEIGAQVSVELVDAHINDLEFADATVEKLDELISQTTSAEQSVTSST
jgi:uncharacterized protein (UPF0261 family)